ncbi:MAG: hypothetical protein WCL43_10080 [Chlorobium sp.]
MDTRSEKNLISAEGRNFEFAFEQMRFYGPQAFFESSYSIRLTPRPGVQTSGSGIH